MGTEILPPGFRLRPAVCDDMEAIAQVVIATDLAESGESDFTVQELKMYWERPNFDPAVDAWVVTAPHPELPSGERVVGYEDLWNRADHAHLDGDGFVHPQYLGLGIGTTLLRALEARARQLGRLAPSGRRVFIRNGVYGSDQAARSLHENEGYRPARFLWRMRIKLKEPPPAPDWPAGFVLRGFTRGQDDRQVFDAFEDAFRDHWGYTPWDYDWWKRRIYGQEDFDPGLWLLASAGDQLAGGVLCSYKQDSGWVNQLAVRRPWRRQGLGLALLYQAFGEFYRRGTRLIGLGVDAQSPTGATRLYQRAGMSVAHEFISYEKEIRPGFNLEPPGSQA